MRISSVDNKTVNDKKQQNEVNNDFNKLKDKINES